ncbi:cyclic peptide export ABC transporter [Aurantimonas aggregata]|uniref:Cyclic peptide export ABC transporter n=1 Tax=Aurantimonas aggregata TaxID=2047720 RepID=A0A6L9MC89_9HYPH|nr:cyclic peptide export ABC transporter [Aurantimonas aggregata]NDV85377.1 cyclic peptide export ABC transporter [Aurantimonas aggregata]
MNIVRLLRGGLPANRRFIFVITCLSGLGNAGLVALINQAAEHALLGRAVGSQLLVAYLLTLAFFLLANRASLQQTNRFVQSRLEATRRRLVAKILRADLRTLETLGPSDIYLTVAQETDHLSQTLPLLIGAAQSAFLLLFLLVYIATLSFVSFVVVAGFIALGIIVFVGRQRALSGALAEVHHREAAMLETLSHFTLGFQEIRLNADKNDAIFRHFAEVTGRLKTVVVGLGGRWVTLLQFSNAFVFLLVGVVVFVLPVFFSGYTDTIYKIVAASVFAIGPMAAITSVVRLVGRAEAGLGHIYSLEQRLDEGAPAAVAPLPRQRSPFRAFASIDLVGTTFRYVDADGITTFTAGPLELSIKRGEIVFMTGGNGSGKSTALKLLCGLYAPTGGRIVCDDVAIDEANRQEYREIFSSIFMDFHLFDRLHGLEDVVPEEVDRLIARMELSDKVGFRKGRFTTSDLSTGQRKRLAMIVSLLEDREVYLFDEWAADQDAHFREVFYTEMLPDLKARGKTVVAVTHDDRYWDRCDRRVALDLGMMLPAGGA